MIMSFPKYSTTTNPYRSLSSRRHLVILLCVAGASPLTFLHHLPLPAVANLQLAGLLDGDGLGGLAGLGPDLLDSLDDVETLDNLAENDVLAIEPRGLDSADEELRAVATVNVRSKSEKCRSCTYVPGPALAMERIPGPVCFRLKFSSSNFSP